MNSKIYNNHLSTQLISIFFSVVGRYIESLYKSRGFSQTLYTAVCKGLNLAHIHLWYTVPVPPDELSDELSDQIWRHSNFFIFLLLLHRHHFFLLHPMTRWVAIAVLALFFAMRRQYLRRADKRPSWCGAENTLTDRPCAWLSGAKSIIRDSRCKGKEKESTENKKEEWGSKTN